MASLDGQRGNHASAVYVHSGLFGWKSTLSFTINLFVFTRGGWSGTFIVGVGYTCGRISSVRYFISLSQLLTPNSPALSKYAGIPSHFLPILRGCAQDN